MYPASTVHCSVRKREAFHHPAQAVCYQQPQPWASPVPTTVVPTSYSAHPHQVDYRHQRRRAHSPHSYHAEQQRPSLPSISSLLRSADDEELASETCRYFAATSLSLSVTDAAAQSLQLQRRLSSQPQLAQTQHHHQRQQSTGTMQGPQQPANYISGSTVTANTRMTHPPTSPMHSGAADGGERSPPSASAYHIVFAAYSMHALLSKMEPHDQGQVSSPMPAMERDSVTSRSMSPYSGFKYVQSPDHSSPGNASANVSYSPEQLSYNSFRMYKQKPLPSNYQPTMPLPMLQPATVAPSINPWQHHHYTSTTNQSALPQSQDRYICPTCNKAFSRLSRFRTHSNIHTGEKPYKCRQAGCGKAFSVRSNMKRHERRCRASKQHDQHDQHDMRT